MHNGKYKCHAAGSCTYHLSSPSCSTRAIQKAWYKKHGDFLFLFFIGGGGGQENRTLAEKWQARKNKRTNRPLAEKWQARKNKRTNRRLAEKWQDRKNRRTRQKNKRADGKGESNDGHDIPDKRKTSDIPGLHSGWQSRGWRCTHMETKLCP